MPAHPVARAKIDEALDLIAKGASAPEAAEATGVSLATLKRYKARLRPSPPSQGPAKASGARGKASPPPQPPPPPRRAARGCGVAPAAAPEDAIPPGAPPPSTLLDAMRRGKVDPADLLPLLHTELAHAIKARQAATAAGVAGPEAKWSKRVEELARAVAHLTPRPPPPPMPPDLVEEALRRLDGETIALIEQHLPDRIDPKEIAA